MNAKRSRPIPRRRSGFTVVEMIVSASVLSVAMATTTVMFRRIDRVWNDVRQQRIATSELSNQLERLTIIGEDELADAIDDLQLSSEASSSLPDANLSSELTRDELGRRITLVLTIDQDPQPREVRLSGWRITVIEASQGPG